MQNVVPKLYVMSIIVSMIPQYTNNNMAVMDLWLATNSVLNGSKICCGFPIKLCSSFRYRL